ncbi:uncharacterized protein CTRU02_211829 [Colletotrichum truncatum]|uniref:Uncharacterized protein n=1 Tax=Colletotrichum truncatum TaxID=5467 RepID=A0ACC3YLU5_COLTU|nr:uncharacterized protein CTRU02_07237 [Colletotrichum truncatum]KAF6791475.1 hypothetical protein CTRU02_07237 [Colletotrichum truncatum]
MVQLALFLSLATLAVTSPLALENRLIATRSDKPSDNVADYCTWDLSTVKGAEEAWRQTDARILLDSFVSYRNKGPDNWLKNFEKFIFDAEDGGGRTKADDCAVIATGAQCQPGHGFTCAEHFKNVNSTEAVGLWPKVAYWIFTAAQQVHVKISRIDHEIQREGLITGLRIEQMLEDFGAEAANDSTDVLGWLSAAFGLVGTFAAPIPIVGTGSSMLSAIFGLIPNPQGGEKSIESKDISSALADLLELSSNHLKTMLRLAMGAAQEGEDYNMLPGSEASDTLSTPIANFFASGWWLIENDEGPIEDMVREMRANIRRKVATNILKSKDVYLVANLNVESPENCVKVGRHWLYHDNKPRCFHLVQCVQLPFDKLPRCGDLKADFHDVKLRRHELGNRIPWYNSMLDCARKGNVNKELDLSRTTDDGSPTCFFNLPVYYADFGEKKECGQGDGFKHWSCDLTYLFPY